MHNISKNLYRKTYSCVYMVKNTLTVLIVGAKCFIHTTSKPKATVVNKEKSVRCRYWSKKTFGETRLTKKHWGPVLLCIFSMNIWYNVKGS